MVITGKARGNAMQLADYLLTQGENERITILEVDGRLNASSGYLKNMLYSMELNSELTRSNKSVYHSTLNPDPNGKEDRVMSMEDWQKAADTLARNLTMEQQRRVIVLHEKKGRMHAHVVFERYSHERDRMIDYKHNYKAHDKARFEIEKDLGHKHTPIKNVDKANHKSKLTEIWAKTKTGAEFVTLAKEMGYQVAKGKDRPFRVVDKNGISFDLVRQLDGVKTKDVKERLYGLKLMDDKKAIELMSQHKKQKTADKGTQQINTSLLNTHKMNWNDMINQDFRTIREIEAHHNGANTPEAGDAIIDKKLNSMYRQSNLAAEAGENIIDLDSQNKAFKTASLLEKQKEQSQDVVQPDLEREQFIKDMMAAREKNRGLTLER